MNRSGRRIVLNLAVLAAWGVLGPAAGWAGEFTVENQTGRAIRELRWSRPEEPGWRDNLLDPGLAPGAVGIIQGPDNGRRDLLAIFEDGGLLVYHGLELEKYRRLRLGGEEAVLFEW